MLLTCNFFDDVILIVITRVHVDYVVGTMSTQYFSRIKNENSFDEQRVLSELYGDMVLCKALYITSISVSSTLISTLAFLDANSSIPTSPYLNGPPACRYLLIHLRF